ncbi:MAG: PH domain-containing protein [Methanomassiliicoccales archaeon]|nr:PH domain-containing protein [Methanomassiliicoccales archaeon]
MDLKLDLNKEFTADPALKSYYLTMALMILAVMTLPWLIPNLAFNPWEDAQYTLYVAVALLAIALVSLIVWIPMYYARLVYGITDDEVVWSRGVLFRKTSIVPYTKITNVDIAQGPVMRLFGIYGLHVQTAGYSAQQAGKSEISIMGVKDHERLRTLMMENVRKLRKVGAPARPLGTDELMLEELRKIRDLLEREA